ncbi:TonB-dependent receptor [Parahaliea maris]|uniref:TonB-dependent receptor n=1 Tax=Parahaliea maris TaxID=2716870 RepID=A0A5C9A333_9GAMM|nr:TonB-dependent receptor [Parahaliea maris]TXS95283.1 TonB-dependent receptor [Parahaliea maris]
MNFRKKYLCAMIGSVSTLTFDSSVIAAEGGSRALEEVVVTAQHREQSILDVPISMTALSGEAMEQMGMETPIDVFAQTPNVTAQLPTSGTGFPIFNIRGVTLLDFTDTNEASVAVYVDEVYLGSPAIQNGQLYDLDRVEILRGPQGTLYGRNSTGGVVQFYSRRPTDELEGYIEGTIGSYGAKTVEGAISGPLGDSVRGRVAVFSNSRDGWQDNVGNVPGASKDFGDIDTNEAIRLTLESDLSDTVMVTGNLHYGNYEGETDQRGFYGKGDPATGELCSIDRIMASQCIDYSTGRTQRGDDPEEVMSDLAKSPIENENYGGWLKLDGALGDMNFTSITSYDTVDKYQILDADNSDAELYALEFYIDHEQFSQEFRLGGGTDTLDWITGLYYYEDSRFFTVTFPQLGNGYGSFAEQEVETTAAFAQATYQLPHNFSVTAGIRYTQDSRDLSEIASILANGQAGTKQGIQGYNVSRSLDASKTTWRLALDWAFAEDQLLYSSISTGFKSGAFNTLYPGAETNVTKADPEEITVYEVGVKGRLIDAVAMTYNVAAFYTDYQNVQAQGTVIIDDTPQSVMANVSDAEIWGMEADLLMEPVSGLTLTLGVGYLDAEYVAGSNDTFNGQLINGNRPVMTPELNVSGSARYEMDLDKAGYAYAMADFNWADDVFFGPDNLATETQEAYAIFNFHLGWVNASESVKIEAFAKNLTDEDYFTHAVDPSAAAPTQVSYTWGMPRTWGLQAKYSF